MESVLYSRIANQLQHRRDALIEPLKLPHERSLAKEMNVGRDTIRRALAQLEKNGAVTRKRGQGTYLYPNTTSPRRRTQGPQCRIRTPLVGRFHQFMVHVDRLRRRLLLGRRPGLPHQRLPRRSTRPKRGQVDRNAQGTKNRRPHMGPPRQ